MPRAVPAVRILPMSDKAEGFVGRSIEEVQRDVFLRWLPRHKGRYRYAKTGLNAEPGTVVLFQYRAHVIASAVFLRDEKFLQAKGKAANQRSGLLHFKADSFRTFDAIDVKGMRMIWPWFKAFGHAKQALNPGLYPLFKRSLRHVRAPGSTAGVEINATQDAEE